MNHILSINNLSKHYGKLKAVNDVSLEVSAGNVYGILGPNGSGKTTLLGMILDVITASSGTYSWFNNMPLKESRKQIGAILEQPSFYPYLSAKKNLEIVARIKGKGKENIDKVLEQVGLFERRNDTFKTYSLGMKQRLSIASALLVDPPVLILDEPTNGLDPQGIAEMRSLIKDVAKRGKTILFASHMLDEVQKVCSHFMVLNFGNKIYDGSVDEVTSQDMRIEIGADNMLDLKTAIQSFNSLDKLEDQGDKLLLKLKNGHTCSDVNKYLVEKGIILNHLTRRKSSLEQQFLKILQQNK